ncbi:hypothetical protein R3W88_000630 [Solanum pinnatisectum]|uniref:Retrotransposon gag domain-containing protein n=1 Tax=Solanum pinnatisectum TaxID=50273 RepID=A0AAV9MHN1_9SOLN|nr:hypothetical protein R3W88_000630 [Solanum pinnatisectum]
MVDIIRWSIGNKIINHASRLKYFVSPVGTEDWFVYLRERSATQIQWKYYWLKPRHAIIRRNELYFIELIGLNGVQPYAPLRVLRQFQQIQMIPLRSHMSHYGYDFGPEIPQVSTILRRWERVVTIDVQEHRPFCTLEYYRGGHSRLGDERERRWARNLLNNNYEITPEMKQQIVDLSVILAHTRSKGTPPSPPLQRADYKNKGKMLPKFELFNGMGDPKAHLRMYCDKLVGIGRDERILMKLFMRSLTGEALSWYIEQDPRKWVEWVDMATDFMNRFGFNIENAPDWFYIQNLRKKPSESFREYAIRWRSEVARARPPMEESQMKDYFIRAQEPQYYDRMMLVAEKSFTEIIKLGERIEEGIRNGTIINLEALQATNKALQSSGMSENRKKTGTVMMAQGTRTPYKYQTTTPPPSPYHQTPYPSAPPPISPHLTPQLVSYPVYNAQPAYFQTPPPTENPNYRNRPPYEKRPTKNYTPLAEPIAQFYERLKEAGYVTPVPALPVDVRAKWYDPNKVCAYHSGMKGHTTEVCRALKDKVQMLIDTKAIQLKDPTPNVANNPLPNHQVNMVEADDTSDWEKSIWVLEPEEATVTPKTPNVVQRRMPFESTPPVQYDTHAVPWNYKKGKARGEEADTAPGVTRSERIYTSENLVHGSSNKSKEPIVELEDQGIWKKVQAKEYSIVEQLSKTLSQISILSLLKSSETHRNALLKVLGEAYVPSSITHGEVAQMVGQDKVITKALVDSGSGLNICPLSTLTRLGVDSAKIHTWKMNVRAFDGSQRGTIREITLDMLIGLATFPITFQVLYIPSSYNLLLGRPWIHMAGVVPSTLHQCLKFEWDHEEVVVHGEKGHPVYAIEGRGNLDGEMFHTVELVGNIEVQPCKICYKNVESETMAYNETVQLDINDLEEVEENEFPEELIRKVEEFEEKPNPNLVETEVVNLGNSEVI